MSRAVYTAASVEITWIRPSSETERPPESWCAAVGPALVTEGTSAATEAGAVAAPLDDLVVVTWNVRAGAGDLLSFVRDLRGGALTGAPVESFVILLQEAYRAGPEVPSDPTRGGLTDPIFVLPPNGPRVDIGEVAKRTGLYAFYTPSMPNGASPDGPSEDRGNAILSTLPLTDLHAIELPYEAQRRVAVAGSIAGTGTDGRTWRLRLASGHLDTRSRLSRFLDSFGRGRARQAQGLAGSLDGDAVVLGADLNTWSADFLEGALDVLYPHFPETPRSAGSTFTAAGVIPRRLDHLLVRLPGGRAEQVMRIPNRYGSDHDPLLTVLRFTS
jgi:endonuclease/exonuclease/phosphatase family metal-dependent hydrolase